MKIKSTLLLFALIMVSGQLMTGQTTGNGVVDLLLSAYSPRSYTTQAVTDQQLDLILKCGIKAPSARNIQPWRFTVVRDEPTMKEIIPNIVEGNVLILVSGVESKEGGTPDFDCGLAAENMFIAATSLGLGARIYGGPAGTANTKREALQVPMGYKVVVILRVGNINNSVDAASGASPRKTAEEIVNYKK
ncbi:MAG TPA: nitroreductase family protein [Bacteroidales bacterium]|nr:nitroreductase family protein [Bacteroidales bacterium]